MERERKFYQFIEDIVNEHFELTRKTDINLNYLWYLYKNGSNSGTYKPFILLAEMQLLKAMGYLSEEEIENMSGMLESEDKDNFNLVWLAIKTLRLARIKEHGEYSVDNSTYTEIEKDYPTKILHHGLFIKAIKR